MWKNKYWQSLILALILTLTLPACSGSRDNNAEKKDVEKVIDDNISWFRGKDFQLLFSTMSNGPDLFMYQLDTRSTIRGFEEFKKYSEDWRDPDLKYAGHRFDDLRVTLSKSGEAAWFSAMLEDCYTYKGGNAKCFTTRYTGVLEKRAGRWLIVQQHFSFPAEKIAPDWAIKTLHPPGKN